MSEFMKLNGADYIKGLIVAVLSAAITFLYELISAQDLVNIDWNQLLTVVVVATLSYLLKNLTTNSDGQPLGREK